MRAMPQIESKPKHYHMNGVYVRELFIPAGALLTGKIHNHESIGILAQGRLRITNGTDSIIVEAPYVTVDKPGVKRLGYAETDCTFLCVHRTDCKTIEEMEESVINSTVPFFTPISRITLISFLLYLSFSLAILLFFWPQK